MARALLFTAAAVAMIAVAFACPACTFMKIAGFDCGKKFDIPSAGKSFSKVCGGQQKIETACKANGACGLYTFGGDADCGYLKTAKPAVGGKIVVERDLTPSKSWSTYIPKEKVVYRNVPVPVPVPTPVYVERRVNVPVPVPVPTPVKVVERRVPVPVPVPVPVERRVNVPVPVPVPVPGPVQIKYVRFKDTSLSKDFDMPTPVGPQYRVCGGKAAIAATCRETEGCEGYSINADGKCGFLKTSNGEPEMYAEPTAFVPVAGGETYVVEDALPPAVESRGINVNIDAGGLMNSAMGMLGRRRLLA